MSEMEIQVGQVYTLPEGVVIVGKYRGASTRYNMLITGGFDKIHSKLQGFNPLSYILFYRIIENIVPKQGNLTCFNITDLAESLNVSQPSIYRALSLLIKNDIIRRVKKGHYIVDPDIAWNGNTWERIKAVAEWKSHCNSNGGADNSKKGA